VLFVQFSSFLDINLIGLIVIECNIIDNSCKSFDFGMQKLSAFLFLYIIGSSVFGPAEACRKKSSHGLGKNTVLDSPK
jgi:hypothetical protein